MAYDRKKIRNLCLDVVAYYAITLLLILGGISEWKANNKFVSILTFIVAAFMVWEGTENLIHHCDNDSTDQIDPIH